MPAETDYGIKDYSATAGAKASVYRTDGAHPSTGFSNGNTGDVKTSTEYLSADASASAGKYTGIGLGANLASLEDNKSKVFIGLRGDTGVGVKDGSFQISFLGLGISLGRETGLSTPVVGGSWKFW